jgi:hypothetical protein
MTLQRRIGRSIVLALAALFARGAWAQQSPTIIDHDMGEEEQIRRRIEWFYETRRAGTSSVSELARLRQEAFRETAARLADQRDARALGLAAGTNVWAEMGPAASHFGGWAFGDVSGRVTALARDAGGGTLYAAAAAGGLWKSTNDGLSWTQLFDAAGTHTIGAIAVDPNAANVLWAGTGDFVQGCEGYFGIGLLRSADGGATWETRNGTASATLEDMSSFSSVVVDPRDSKHVVVGGRFRGCSSGNQATGGLFSTTDAGITWTKRLASTEIHEILQNPSSLDTWWAATNKGIYKSTDNGVTWVLQTASGLPNGNTGRTEIAISPSNSQVVYALFESPNQIWRTTNGGASWTMMSSGGNACDGQCWYNMVLRVHPTVPDTIYRGTVHVFKSIDGGATWTDLSNSWGSSQKVHQDTHAFLTDSANPGWLWVGSDGGVWKSTDGGASFTGLNSNLSMTQFYAIGVHPTDTGIICGGAQDNSSLARGGPTNVWDLQAVTGDGFVCAIDPGNPNYAYITSYPSGGYPSVSRSTTGVFGSFGGITGPGSGIVGGDRSNWVTPYVLDPISPNILYLGTQRVYKSVDHGTTWVSSAPSDMTAGSGTILSLEVNRSFTATVFAGTDDGRVWRSTNAATSWTNITSGLPARSINDIAGDPSNGERVFVVVGGFGTSHLWEKTGDGPWIARGDGLPNVPANTVLLLTANDVLVGTDVGVFRSQDGGRTFVPFMEGLPEGLVVTDLKFDMPTNRLTAGTYGRGAWQVAVDPVEPIVIFDSIVLPLTQVDGDGDGNVEPGETWRLTPVLRNVGGQVAFGVTATVATGTPGVMIEPPASRSFGNLAPGVSAAAAQPVTFTVDPAFSCGGAIVFDVVNIASTNAPNSYPSRNGAFVVTVADHFNSDVITTLLDEDFDPAPPSGWTHNAVNPGLAGCSSQTYRDDWKILSKDSAHGQSYHCGNGPGTQYPPNEYAWLHFGGKDSTNGPGITIPADANSALLTVTHWYSTQTSQDGAQVAVDSTLDDLDVYTTLVPDAGYPGSLVSGFCNGLENKSVFTGTSVGWITSTFDLSNYVGRTIYLAFVFGSDRFGSANEGWYIDLVKVESRKPGNAVCQVTRWPGVVPGTATFDKSGGDLLATWAPSCNLGPVPGQTYSIQAGNLDALNATGTYTHAPLASQCDRTSPAAFAPGPGNEYYLIVPNSGGVREGSPGVSSTGLARPQPSALCGDRHFESCP